MMLERLKELAAAGLMRQLDYQFAAVLAGLGESRDGVLLAAALASSHLGRGDVCVDLAEAAGGPLFDSGESSFGGAPLVSPELESWLEELRDSPLVSDGSEPAPLVLDRAQVQILPAATPDLIERCLAFTSEAGDARILADALVERIDHFVTTDQEHFLDPESIRGIVLFAVVTPQECLEKIRQRYMM